MATHLVDGMLAYVLTLLGVLSALTGLFLLFPAITRPAFVLPGLALTINGMLLLVAALIAKG